MSETQIINRLDELVQNYSVEKLNSMLDEWFEGHLSTTNLTGPPLADHYFILCEIKALISVAGQLDVRKLHLDENQNISKSK